MLMRYQMNGGDAAPAIPGMRELTQIETSYGRLVYLAGLLNPDSGRYEHYGASDSASSLATSRAFKRVHEQIFTNWIALPLKRKMADIQLYISSISQVDRGELID